MSGPLRGQGLTCRPAPLCLLPPAADMPPHRLLAAMVPSPQQTTAGLLDHSIRGGEQRRRDVEAQRFGGLAVDHKLEFRRLLYRKFVRFCATQDLIDISCRTLRARVRIGPITEEGTFPCPRAKAGCKQQVVLA